MKGNILIVAYKFLYFFLYNTYKNKRLLLKIIFKKEHMYVFLYTSIKYYY